MRRMITRTNRRTSTDIIPTQLNLLSRNDQKSVVGTGVGVPFSELPFSELGVEGGGVLPAVEALFLRLKMHFDRFCWVILMKLPLSFPIISFVFMLSGALCRHCAQRTDFSEDVVSSGFISDHFVS